MTEEERPKRHRKTQWEDRFLGVLKDSGNVSGAARLAGVARATVYRRYNENKTFADAWDAAVEEAKETLATVIYKAGADGDWRAAAWFLERQDPQRWGGR